MEAQQSFEYEGYLINLCSSEGGSKVRLEAIAPDREAQYLGEQKLERFNYKTFVAALSKANSKLNVEITYPEETKMVVSLLFSDPLVGKMSECVTLTKQGNVVLHDRLKYLSSKLGVQLSAYKKISSTFASGTFFSSYVPQCGIDPSRLQQINYEQEDYYDEVESSIVDKEVASITLPEGMYLVTISMFMQAPMQEYNILFGRMMSHYGCLPTDPNTGYSGPPSPISYRDIYTVDSQSETCKLLLKNYCNSPLSITNCVITAQLMKR